MPVLRALRDPPTGRRVLLAAALLVLMALVSGSAAGQPLPPGATPGMGSGCPGAAAPTTYTGSIAIVGGPLSPSYRAGVTLQFAFSIESIEIDRSTGVVVSDTCETENGTAVSNASGAFGFAATPPTYRCPPLRGSGDCVEFAGPYGPVTVNPPAALPAGYFVRVTQAATHFGIEYVALLAGVGLAPTGAGATTSVGAPETFRATATTGLGNVSPLAVSWNWSVSGSGWSLVDRPTGAIATVRASSGRANGSLLAMATATVDGAPWTVESAPLALVAIATTVTATTLSRTTVDAGASVEALFNGAGASDFNYSGTVVLGGGLSNEPAACSTADAGPGRVSIACHAYFTDPDVGTATIGAGITNGFSNASGSFPLLHVIPPPVVSVLPKDSVEYSGATFPVEVAIAPGSGLNPYREACLAAGPGAPVCSAAAGPNWTFSAEYPAAGNFTLRAWAIDADGTNRTATAAVRIVAPLELGPLSVRGNASFGYPLELSSTVVGGDLPGWVWWNSSALGAPIATEPLGGDGPISVTFVANVAGTARLSLTVADGLGSTAEESVSIAVPPAPSDSVTPSTMTPVGTATVGRPIDVAWQAFDPSGAPNHAYAAPAELLVEHAGTQGEFPAWVNLSGNRSLVPLGGAAVAVPAAAWTGGVLDLSITAAAAGPLELRLVDTGLPTAVAPVDTLVLPDLEHLVLSDPLVHEPGTRTNATFWHVADRFGDPVPGGYLIVQTLAAGFASDDLVPVTEIGPNESGAWVNYSVPAPLGATVRVLDRAGQLLLDPIVVGPVGAPSSAGSPTWITLGTAVPIGVAVAGASAALRRRRSVMEPPDPDGIDPALERLAVGRARVVEMVRRAGAIDLASLEGAWEPPPAPPDLADWLASLIADGTLGAAIGPDGVARFAVAAPPAGPPRVTIDVAEFDRALARRAAAVAEEDRTPEAP